MAKKTINMDLLPVGKTTIHQDIAYSLFKQGKVNLEMTVEMGTNYYERITMRNLSNKDIV